MKKKYYLPISSASLSHYFGSACIAPSKYFSNKPGNLQDIAYNKLIFTGFLGARNCDCCLEIILTETEEIELDKVINDIYLYSKPLPITRVKTIIFNSENQKQQTVANIELSTAFIPRDIIRVMGNFEDADLSSIEISINEPSKDYSEQILLYDKLLGGFSLMKFGGEEYMNYSPNYFSTLSFFNQVIKQELIVLQKNINPLFHDIFKGETSFKLLNKYLYKPISEDDLIEISTIEKQHIIKDKITKLIDLNKLEKASYIVAVLNTYGTGNEARKKKVDGLILSNFKSEIVPEKSEVASLCYGINRGYTAFNNSYKYQDKRKDVKFKLDSQLDYYTIESLYQYALYKRETNEFPYLDEWCPKKKIGKIIQKPNYLMLDIEVVEMKKPEVISQIYLSNLLLKLFQKDTASLLSSFIKLIRDKIYEDTLNEVQERIEEKDNEIDNLKRKLASTNNVRLEDSESSICYANSDDFSDDLLIETLELKGLSLVDFKKAAKANGINIPNKGFEDKKDRDKLIIQIIKLKKQGTLKL